MIRVIQTYMIGRILYVSSLLLTNLILVSSSDVTKFYGNISKEIDSLRRFWDLAGIDYTTFEAPTTDKILDKIRKISNQEDKIDSLYTIQSPNQSNSLELQVFLDKDQLIHGIYSEQKEINNSRVLNNKNIKDDFSDKNNVVGKIRKKFTPKDRKLEYLSSTPDIPIKELKLISDSALWDRTSDKFPSILQQCIEVDLDYSLKNKEILELLVIDSKYLCRLAYQWVEKLPIYFERMKNINEIKRDYRKNDKTYFLRKWFDILKESKVIKVYTDKFKSNIKLIRYLDLYRDSLSNYSGDIDIGSYIYAYNIVLCQIFSELSYYISLVALFPMFIEHKKIKILSNPLIDNLDNMNDNIENSKTSISIELKEKIFKTISTCGSVIVNITSYGISNAPSDIVALYNQLKQILATLINISELETEDDKGELLSVTTDKIPFNKNYEQYFVSNTIGFSTNKISGSFNSINKTKETLYDSNSSFTNKLGDSDKYSLDKKKINGMVIKIENNDPLFNITYPLIQQKLPKGVKVTRYRPDGLPSIIIYKNEVIHEISTIQFRGNKLEMTFKDMTSSLTQKVTNWFSNIIYNDQIVIKYLQHFNKINIEFQIGLICVYTIEQNLGSESSLGDIYGSLVLFGRLPDFQTKVRDWSIISQIGNFSSDTKDVASYINILNPFLLDETNSMCPLQRRFLLLDELKYSEKVSINKVNSVNSSKSILVDCLNYVPKDTKVAFIPANRDNINSYRSSAIATCIGPNFTLKYN
ncbi:hypothetical protein cand_001940 [Cryptosporidium andersoni]|uniref:Uncharacterized protein n=1 Tax=Cryptosporidium andersoni TaxID=117008 RepID=A0A1J4MQA2_9CRYT|nr:hypothetical protein cand_001940 [Cryptosporidium andersoni]